MNEKAYLNLFKIIDMKKLELWSKNISESTLVFQSANIIIILL
jgi:hypothetical protein